MRIYLTNKEAIKFDFTQTPYSFKVVESIKLKPQKRGFYRLIEVTKKNRSTIELIEYLSSVLKIEQKEIGYAGLKDKNATTTQYLTLPREVKVDKFKNSAEVEIQEVGFVSKPLKIGDLVSNSFTIILENMNEAEYEKFKKAIEKIKKQGFANFFGYQRFGKSDQESIKKGKKIAYSGDRVKNQRGRILVASYQSKMFNDWLNRRLEISKLILEDKKDNFLKQLSPTLYKTIQKTDTLFKLLPGDLGYIFKSGRKNFLSVNDIEKFSDNFAKREFHPTGVLYGNSVRLSSSIAKIVESEFIDYNFNALRGARRDAWIWPKNLKYWYNPQKKSLKLIFSLPPGSYATVLLEELANKELK